MSNFPQVKKIALDNTKLGLSAPCPTAEGKWSNLRWGLGGGSNPRITVYTGDPNDSNQSTNNGRIRAELDTVNVYSLLLLIRQAIVNEPGWKKNIKCSNFIYPGGKRSEKPVHLTDVWVGKDRDGIVYLSVVDAMKKDRPVIKFPILADQRWQTFIHGDGTPFTKAEASTLYAEAYAMMLQQLYGNLLVTEYKPPEPRDNNRQGGNGGGYQRNNNGGGNGAGSGGYNNRSQSSSDIPEDDLPF
jgi:hypothetical protein